VFSYQAYRIGGRLRHVQNPHIGQIFQHWDQAFAKPLVIVHQNCKDRRMFS
jgi:hypothetical protein